MNPQDHHVRHQCPIDIPYTNSWRNDEPSSMDLSYESTTSNASSTNSYPDDTRTPSQSFAKVNDAISRVEALAQLSSCWYGDGSYYRQEHGRQREGGDCLIPPGDFSDVSLFYNQSTTTTTTTTAAADDIFYFEPQMDLCEDNRDPFSPDVNLCLENGSTNTHFEYDCGGSLVIRQSGYHHRQHTPFHDNRRPHHTAEAMMDWSDSLTNANQELPLPPFPGAGPPSIYSGSPSAIITTPTADALEPQLHWRQRKPKTRKAVVHECTSCITQFGRGQDLKRHKDTVHTHSVNPHLCNYCNKTFSRRDSMLRHQRKSCHHVKHQQHLSQHSRNSYWHAQSSTSVSSHAGSTPSLDPDDIMS